MRPIPWIAGKSPSPSSLLICAYCISSAASFVFCLCLLFWWSRENCGPSLSVTCQTWLRQTGSSPAHLPDTTTHPRFWVMGSPLEWFHPSLYDRLMKSYMLHNFLWCQTVVWGQVSRQLWCSVLFREQNILVPCSGSFGNIRMQLALLLVNLDKWIFI